jgi:NAD(P)-dependent dehydrogenase (short-subunit alcohol dehydrogenase family)
MGEALSRELVKKGWKVAMADIQSNEALSKELGSNAVFFKTNVADYDSQAATFQGTWDRFGRIDALCANAGIVDRRFVHVEQRSDYGADFDIVRFTYSNTEDLTRQSVSKMILGP